ncbi:MAG: isochorismatase family protein [Nanoarchaeota archaeon]|nr:isochorismatase family protein [Nanoarchaeota archaeon]
MKFIDFLSKTFGKKEFSPEKRAKYDYNVLSGNFNSFAVISVDLQKNSLDNMNKNSREILLRYHRELAKICKKKGTHYLYVEFGEKDRHILREQGDVYFTKSFKSALELTNIESYLKRENISTVYVIGLERKLCIYFTIKDLIMKKFNVITSIIGTATTQTYYRGLGNVKNGKTTVKESHRQIQNLIETYEKEPISAHGIKEELNHLKKLGVKILDYKD